MHRKMNSYTRYLIGALIVFMLLLIKSEMNDSQQIYCQRS